MGSKRISENCVKMKNMIMQIRVQYYESGFCSLEYELFGRVVIAISRSDTLYALDRSQFEHFNKKPSRSTKERLLRIQKRMMEGLNDNEGQDESFLSRR